MLVCHGRRYPVGGRRSIYDHYHLYSTLLYFRSFLFDDKSVFIGSGAEGC